MIGIALLVISLGTANPATPAAATTRSAENSFRQSSPQCRNLRYRANFRLNGAQQYLAQAEAQSYEPDKRRAIGNALRVLGEAVRAGGELDQLTLWYFFGKAYALSRDLAGADSAWTRVEQLAASANDADCVREIGRLRRNERVPFVNGAFEQIQSQRYDSALALLRQANRIYRGDPATYINMATVFYNLERVDSAIAYFRQASRAGDDPAQAEVRATAAFNAARLLQGANRHAEAEAAFREYLRMRPRDMAARAALAAVLTSQNRRPEAAAIYDSILASADSLESFDLFETGVALFRQAQADSTDRAMQSRRFAQAALAFELGLRKNPLHRDAVFNLTNTYLAMDDTARAFQSARRLVEIDPLNRQSMSILAEVYRRRALSLRTRYEALAPRRDSVAAAQEVRRRFTALQDSTVALIQRRDSLPAEVNVLRFEPRDSTASIRGGVRNLQPRERAPSVLTLEFVSGRGEVVATERVELPALNPAGSPGSSYDFNLQVSGRGIIAYRYRL